MPILMFYYVIYFSYKIWEVYTLSWIFVKMYSLVHESWLFNKQESVKFSYRFIYLFIFGQKHCSCGLSLKLYRNELTSSFYFVTFALVFNRPCDFFLENARFSCHWAQSVWLSENTAHNIDLFPVNEAQN